MNHAAVLALVIYN